MPPTNHSRGSSRPARYLFGLLVPAVAVLAAAVPSHESRPLRLRAPDLPAQRVELYPEESHPRDPIKERVFEQINRDRATAGLAPVAWDEAASRAADEFCQRQVTEKTRGHFLTDGLPPYARMSFAGVFGLDSENSVSWISTGDSFDEPLEKLALEGHAEMMLEKPPLDGHRRTILDPDATHVGVGYASGHGRFQMAQEFLVRGLARLSLSPIGKGAKAVLFDGRPGKGQTLRFVTVAWEPTPTPLTRQEASGRTSYTYPTPRVSFIPEGYLILRVSGTTSEDRLRMRPDRSFTFDFQPSRSGLYTLVFYLSSNPIAEPRPGASTVLWFD